MYRLREKSARNKLILQYREANPELTLAEIGDAFKISRQRVSIIIKATRLANGKRQQGVANGDN